MNAKIKLNDVFDQDKIQEERERIVKDIRNYGYFYFNREYIWFNADTNIVGNFVDLKLVISNPENGNHKSYKLNTIPFHL